MILLFACYVICAISEGLASALLKILVFWFVTVSLGAKHLMFRRILVPLFFKTQGITLLMLARHISIHFILHVVCVSVSRIKCLELCKHSA
jgi:hypothetical protein